VHATNTYLSKFPPAEAAARLKKIQESVNSSTPIKPGGQYSFEHQLEFLRWAKATQSPEDARQLFNIAQTYAKAAVATHIFSSPSMQQMAQLNFDKIPLPSKPMTAAQQASMASSGRSLLMEMRRQEAALTLQGRQRQ